MDDMLGLTAPHEAHGFGLGLAGAKGGGYGTRGPNWPTKSRVFRRCR